MDSKARRQRAPARPKAASKPNVGKSAVVIAGMHRSGTSVVARTLSLLGCSLPQTLVGPSRNNERGYWESRAVVDMNDEILASAGLSWDDWEPVNAAWFRSPVAADFRSRAHDVLAAEFGTSRLFVLKDPRIARLLPFWTEVLDGFGATQLVVCPLRNPLEVAASLEARNQVDASIGHLLWLRHVLDAEAASRGLKRAFVRYDDLVECWQETADRLSDNLGIGWPRRSRASDQEIQQFIDQALRHHARKDSSVLRNSSLSRWIRSSFEILGRWTRDDVRDSDAAALDGIRSEFDSAAIAFRQPVAVGREAAQAATKLQGTLEKRDARLDERDAKVDELRKSVEMRDAEIAALAEKLKETRVRLEARDAKVDELRKSVETRDAEIGVLAEKLKETRGRLEARDAKVDELRKSVETRDAEIGVLAERLKAEGARADELAGRLERREGEAAELTADVARRETLIAELRAELAERAHEAEQVAAELAAAQETLRITARAAAEKDKLVASLQALVDFKSTALRDKRTAYAALETEIIGRSQ
ncbi:MAG: hypothetical protein ACOC9Q_02080 [bacterium]